MGGILNTSLQLSQSCRFPLSPLLFDDDLKHVSTEHSASSGAVLPKQKNHLLHHPVALTKSYIQPHLHCCFRRGVDSISYANHPPKLEPQSGNTVIACVKSKKHPCNSMRVGRCFCSGMFLL